MAQYDAITKYAGEYLYLGSRSDHTGEESSNASPNSAKMANSPTNALAPSVSVKQERTDFDNDKQPTSGPQRQNSSGTSDKEKRKRSRVTPEQLVQLERYFAMDRSPTASRRRDISDLLGMQERQIQIWFQNRRAKAKLLDGKHGSRGHSMEATPQTPPESPLVVEGDLHNLIHEDGPVTIIPCTDLTVGTWRRIATSEKHDLVAYISELRRCLIWFIQSGGYGFKMEVPFDTVIDTQYDNVASGSALAVFVLSQPPTFYLENISSPRSDGSAIRTWKRCSDWTEGHQATQVLRHTLVGSAAPLALVLRNLHGNTDVGNLLPRAPPYRLESLSFSPMEIPPPPLTNLDGSVFPYVGPKTKNSQVNQRSKRPSYSSVERGYAFAGGLQSPPHSAPAKSSVHHPYLSTSSPRDSNLEPTRFQSYHSHPDPAISGYAVGPVPRSATSAPYPARTQYYDNSPHALQADLRSESHPPPNPPPNLSQAFQYNTPSTLSLTAPYYQATTIDRWSNSIQTPSPASSSMSGVVYEGNEDFRGR